MTKFNYQIAATVNGVDGNGQKGDTDFIREGVQAHLEGFFGKAQFSAEIVITVEEQPGSEVRHIIKYADDGYTVQHPLICRPNLFECPFVHVECPYPTGETSAPGRYYCSTRVNEYGDTVLVVDERVDPAS